MPYDRNSTTNQVIEGVDLSGKIAVVTGASAGLGVETSRCLAAAGATVVMVGRDAGKLDDARGRISEQVPEERLDTEIMDLADLSSIRSAANAIGERHPRIHLLINNAGVMACPRAQTRDGFELQFGTNHIGHFLFTCLLVPNLLAAAPARVVNLSSSGHRFGKVDFDDPNFERRDYDKWLAYGQSKTANALFSVALNRRLAERGVTANAVHPGVIETELGRHLDDSDRALPRGLPYRGAGWGRRNRRRSRLCPGPSVRRAVVAFIRGNGRRAVRLAIKLEQKGVFLKT